MISSQFSNPLPGVPLIDNPFFDNLFPQLNPDAETLRIASDLRNKGYAILEFPDPDIDRKCDEIKARYAPSREKLDGWRAGQLDLRIPDAWRHDSNVNQIATNAKVLKLLETLYGRPAIPFQTLNFAVGTQQPFHDDSVHFSTVPDGFMCGVWVALEDVDDNNGPLIYYPGSHNWPHFYNEHIGVNSWHLTKRGAKCEEEYVKLYDELSTLYRATPERFFAKKGQAIIWAAHLLHGGDKQRDPMRTRFSQVTHYFFAGCSYYTPMYSDPFYGNIHFRKITNIANGALVRNMVSGRNVPPWFECQAWLMGRAAHYWGKRNIGQDKMGT
jgi:hypothetical protein